MPNDLEILEGKVDDIVEEKVDGKVEEKDEDKVIDNAEELLEDIEDKEDKEEEKEENEDEDDEPSLASDNVYQDLKAAYPTIFKEHPELKHVIFREREYTNLFPTVDDAKQGAERLEVFDSFEKDLMSGDPSSTLEAIQNTNKDSFQAFVGNFLPALEKLSKDLHLQAVAPSIKKMLRAASKDPNDAYSKAAKNIHHYIFGDFDFDKNVGVEVKDVKKEDSSKNEFFTAMKDNFDREIVDAGSRRLQKEISDQFKDSGLSEFMVESLTEKMFNKIGASLQSNPRHMAEMKMLYKAAEKARFSGEHKRSLILAYLRRAKTMIPKVRQEVLAKAKIQLKDKPQDSSTNKVRIPASGSVARTTTKVDTKKVDWNKSGSDADILRQGFVSKDK